MCETESSEKCLRAKSQLPIQIGYTRPKKRHTNFGYCSCVRTFRFDYLSFILAALSSYALNSRVSVRYMHIHTLIRAHVHRSKSKMFAFNEFLNRHEHFFLVKD